MKGDHDMPENQRTTAMRPAVQFLIDTHFTPSSVETFSDFTPERIIDGLKQMGVDSVMFQAKCARGMAYYDSRIAPRHPNLKSDIITPLLRQAKQAGLEVFLYTCTAADFYCTEHYPDMWMLDQNGRPCGEGVVCTNGPYRKRYVSLMAELAQKFPLDGVFVDGPDPAFGAGAAWPTPCYCESCKALWLERYGKPLPINAQRVCREQLVEFLDANCDTFITQVTGALRGRRPKARLWHNTSRPTAVQDEAYHEVDAYHRNFYRPSLFMKRHRAACGDIPRVYSLTMDKPVRHSQSAAMIAWEMATYLAHRPADVVIWSTPDLQTMWYVPDMVEKARWAIEQTNALRDEMAADMTVIADIAIGHSRKDLLLNFNAAPENICRDDAAGAHRLLSEAQIPFDYVDLDRPLAMGKTPVLMINGVQTLPPAQVKAILGWVRKGGKLILTGRGVLVDAMDGLKLGPPVTIENTSNFAGRTPVAYVKPDWRPDGDAWSTARGYSPVLSHTGWKAIGWILPQAVYRVGMAFDVSHRPSAKPSGPAILCRKLGKGGVVYFNHEPFAESIDRGANLFRDIPAACLRQLGVQPRFGVHGCQSIEANYYKTADGVQIVLTNGFVGRPIVANGEPSPWAEMNEVITVADIAITTNVPFARAYSRQLGELEVERPSGQAAIIRLPRLGLWDVIHLE
jgi:hypothetical protein